MVERLPSKQDVVGSIPILRSNKARSPAMTYRLRLFGLTVVGMFSGATLMPDCGRGLNASGRILRYGEQHVAFQIMQQVLCTVNK